MGAPSKLTPELKKKLCEYLQLGLPEEIAANAAGITDSCYFSWKARGEKEKTGPYASFLDEVKKAVGGSQASCLAIIRTAARGGQWQAAAWIAERRWPQHYARTERLQHETAGGQNVTINVTLGSVSTKPKPIVIEAATEPPRLLEDKGSASGR